MRGARVEIFRYATSARWSACRPPCGGRGLKSILCSLSSVSRVSPSVRGARVEIASGP